MIRAIEDVRKTKGFTQEYVAKAVGVAISSYSQYETGARSVPAEVAERIADVLDVEISEIFFPSKFTIRGIAGEQFTDGGRKKWTRLYEDDEEGE